MAVHFLRKEPKKKEDIVMVTWTCKCGTVYKKPHDFASTKPLPACPTCGLLGGFRSSPHVEKGVDFICN